MLGSVGVGMQLCRIATQFSLRTPECTDIITRAYSLRWIEKGFSTYDVTSDQAGSKAAAEDSIPTSLLSPSQAEYDGLPTIPASEFGQSFSSDHSMSSQRVQSLRHPRSIEFYHRRCASHLSLSVCPRALSLPSNPNRKVYRSDNVCT